jgi:hypothetical protein
MAKTIPDFNHNGNTAMNNDDFNELAGRIQGLGDYLISLTAYLEMNQLIDGEYFTRNIQRFAENRCFDGEHLDATKRTLSELARFVDEARQNRMKASYSHARQRQRRPH